MLARYIGSKQAILEPLIGVIGRHCEPVSHVVDAFSGSLAVSLAMKRAGYRVTANDINLFSAVLGEAYLLPPTPPQPNAPAILGTHHANRMIRKAQRITETLRGVSGYDFLADPEWRHGYEHFVALQQYLQHVHRRGLPAGYRKSHFFDSYCEEGKNSQFLSARGVSGRRRFFTAANADRLDLALNMIRFWHREGQTDPHTHALLLSSLMRAMEKVANTQGTYHDFPRTVWDPRALAPLTLEPPSLDPAIGGIGGHSIGRERDSLEFIAEIDDHDVLYLDPPYNFRQYTAYYFLPNVLCRYPEMEDPDEYFEGLCYVRGQHPDDDFTSTFCKPARFIDDMRTLIRHARCRTVVISYFTGRNHWGAFDSGPDNAGRQRLSALLVEEMFEPGSLTITEIPRRNYASYGGYTARTVDELVLTATKVGQDEQCESAVGTQGRLQALAR
jgi:adenine-specific DNA methylase